MFLVLQVHVGSGKLIWFAKSKMDKHQEYQGPSVLKYWWEIPDRKKSKFEIHAVFEKLGQSPYLFLKGRISMG